MELNKLIEFTRIDEIKILSNVRLVHRHDINPIYSKENLRTQFEISGDIKGAVTCFLCLDGHELTPSEKNYIFPLFIEAMNILIGKQISLDPELSLYSIRMSPPKLSMISQELNSKLKNMLQSYELELDGYTFTILIEYSIEAMN
jgi:hypothetical protein